MMGTENGTHHLSLSQTRFGCDLGNPFFLYPSLKAKKLKTFGTWNDFPNPNWSIFKTAQHDLKNMKTIVVADQSPTE